MRPPYQESTHAPSRLQLTIDRLDRRGPLLVDLLGLGRSHPLPPIPHRWAVGTFGLVGISPGLAWLGHWHVNRRVIRRCLIDRLQLREAPIDQLFFDLVVASLFHLFSHRLAEARVAARVGHLHSHDRTALRVHGQLHVVRWAIASIRHPHESCLGVGHRGPRRVLLGWLVFLFGLGLLDLVQLLQCLFDPGQLLLRRTVFGLLPADCGFLRSLGLTLDNRQVVAGLLTGLFQRVTLLEAVGPGTDPDAGAVLGYPVDADSLALNQDREHLGQKVVQGGFMSDPRIAECVVVDRHSAAEPAIWVALAAESIQLASMATPRIAA